MSVIIKGMAMPETCYECRFCEEHSEYPFAMFCVAHLNCIEDARSGRLETCPLVELHDHGDLIDRDALIENAGMRVSDFGTPDEQWRPDRDWYLTINAQTIIIPAERSESDE